MELECLTVEHLLTDRAHYWNVLTILKMLLLAFKKRCHIASRRLTFNSLERALLDMLHICILGYWLLASLFWILTSWWIGVTTQFNMQITQINKLLVSAALIPLPWFFYTLFLSQGNSLTHLTIDLYFFFLLLKVLHFLYMWQPN
jgi:hypothetical protein